MASNNGQKLAIAGAATLVAEPALALAHTGGLGVIVGFAAGAVAYWVVDEIEQATGKEVPLPAGPAAKRAREPGQPSLFYRMLNGKSVRGEYTEDSQGDEPGDAPPLDNSHERRMRLSQDWQPDVEGLTGLGIVCYGIKGAGKTNVGALLAEQFGQYYIPEVIFDKEGDYLSLVDVLPNGYIAGHPSAAAKYDPDTFLAVDMGAAQELGAAILTNGYQVVFDLASYPDDEARARIMAVGVKSLMTHADSIPNRGKPLVPPGSFNELPADAYSNRALARLR